MLKNRKAEKNAPPGLRNLRGNAWFCTVWWLYLLWELVTASHCALLCAGLVAASIKTSAFVRMLEWCIPNGRYKNLPKKFRSHFRGIKKVVRTVAIRPPAGDGADPLFYPPEICSEFFFVIFGSTVYSTVLLSSNCLPRFHRPLCLSARARPNTGRAIFM